MVTRSRETKCVWKSYKKTRWPLHSARQSSISFGQGISRSGEIIDLGSELNIIKKSGSWYSYTWRFKLGQGRDAAKTMCRGHPELADEFTELIFEALKPTSICGGGQTPPLYEIAMSNKDKYRLLCNTEKIYRSSLHDWWLDTV